MFNFEEPEDGSQERFRTRQRMWEGLQPFDKSMVSEAPNPETFTINPHNLPKIQHYMWWLLHNLVAHPVIAIAPVKVAFDFHDWSSRKLNGL
jgi:hypothetical protein